MPVHSHEYYEFMFVNSGKCDVFVEEKSGAMETLTLGKSDFVLSLINKFRIQKAIELLRSSSLPLIDVAIEVGFNNRQSFFNAFKKYTGVSPNEYRREHIDNEKWLKNESYTTSVFEDEG